MGWAIAGVAVIAALAIVFVFRLRYVSQGGAFECGLRRRGAHHVAEGWARYARGRVEWYALASYRIRPSRWWSREELADLAVVGSVTSARGNELLVITVPGEPTELLMWRTAYAGLRSWLEAAPPRPSAGSG